MPEHDILPFEDIARIRAIVDCIVRHDKAGVDRLLDKPIGGHYDFWKALQGFESDFRYPFGPLPEDFQTGMKTYTLSDSSGWLVEQAFWYEHGEISDISLILDVNKSHPRNRIEIYDLRVL